MLGAGCAGACSLFFLGSVRRRFLFLSNGLWFGCNAFSILQYYTRTGTCKFGVSCKFHHPKQGIGSAVPVALNFYGYPLRPVRITSLAEFNK